MSPAYAAIEQHISVAKVGPWTDIYALGATFYQVATGIMPQTVTERIYDDKLVPAREAAPNGFSPSFLAAIDRALVIRPEDRPQTIAEWFALFTAVEDDSDGLSDTAVLEKRAAAQPAKAHARSRKRSRPTRPWPRLPSVPGSECPR